MYSIPGESGDQSLAPPRTSPRRGARPTGNAVRRGRDKGPRLHDWCYVELADLDAGSSTAPMTVCGHAATDPSPHRDDDLAFFTTWCPQEQPSKAGRSRRHRWAIEDSFETAKNEFGRSQREPILHGWHRHVSMVMLAFA